MTQDTRGRIAPTPPQPYPGNAETFAGVHSWNSPRAAINPVDFAIDPPVSALAQWIRMDIEDRKAAERREIDIARSSLTERDRARLARRDYLIDVAEEREQEQQEQTARNKEAQRTASQEPDADLLASLHLLPRYLRQPLLLRLNYFRKQQIAAELDGKSDKPANAFMRDVIKRALPRLEQVNRRNLTAAYSYIAGRERLDELLRLPELDKREVKLVATLTAGAMEMLFSRLCDQHFIEGPTPEAALRVYQLVASEALRLNVVPPQWDALDVRRRKRGKIPYHLLPGALARLCCATWWQRRLWRYRCEWREEQLRAVCQVGANTSAFVSNDALVHKREQRRLTREFIKSHELVNDDGVRLDMEDVYYAGNSNPQHRRFEMMATMKGLENVAELRGDSAVWCTITCPSKYHATLTNGKPNRKWTARTVRDSSDYLVDMFASVRKKLNRNGLRWYGIRVAEPHHDGTVHWHMMIFTRPDEREAVIDILQEFAIRVDLAELGEDITPRFKAELITKDKGTPCSYIAAYIGKNIDGAPLRKPDPKTGKVRVDHESGKSMADTVEHAIAWASLHRVRQFQFFGIPSRQTYRELRLLAGQMSRIGITGKKKQRLTDKAMDDVLSAADAGCIATYILKQGGVLSPRCDHVVRTAYSEADKPNDYDEINMQIYGVWSPQLGDESRICTHTDNWQLVRKTKPANGAADRPGVDLDRKGGPSAPWTRGNNCPPGQINDSATAPAKPKTAVSAAADKRALAPPDSNNFDQMTRSQRRELLRWLRANP
ncbi:replication endonuclease [Serratia fonticola]|uniref:replication endonuclease n=1 Tax=Serratia fonticola TaxID=47917 RepID=UPI0015C5903D|nr:replication endonuclease [Serratia fonticola]NXZ86277.1 replication endonuclease [Serratia fonticola]